MVYLLVGYGGRHVHWVSLFDRNASVDKQSTEKKFWLAGNSLSVGTDPMAGDQQSGRVAHRIADATIRVGGFRIPSAGNLVFLTWAVPWFVQIDLDRTFGADLTARIRWGAIHKVNVALYCSGWTWTDPLERILRPGSDGRRLANWTCCLPYCRCDDPSWWFSHPFSWQFGVFDLDRALDCSGWTWTDPWSGSYGPDPTAGNQQSGFCPGLFRLTWTDPWSGSYGPDTWAGVQQREWFLRAESDGGQSNKVDLVPTILPMRRSELVFFASVQLAIGGFDLGRALVCSGWTWTDLLEWILRRESDGG
jgi:hypothetical protein